jgi:hypothetical protein
MRRVISLLTPFLSALLRSLQNSRYQSKEPPRREPWARGVPRDRKNGGSIFRGDAVTEPEAIQAWNNWFWGFVGYFVLLVFSFWLGGRLAVGVLKRADPIPAIFRFDEPAPKPSNTTVQV